MRLPAAESSRRRQPHKVQTLALYNNLLKGSDVGMRTLWPMHAALIGQRGERVIGVVDRRASRQQGIGLGRPAVVLQRSQLGIDPDDVELAKDAYSAAA